MSLIVIPIVPFLIIIPLMFVDIDPLYLAIIPVPVAALFLGWSLHNDVAYDNTAIWVHVVSDTPGVADRFGRAIPTLIVGIPLLVLGSCISAAIAGDASILPSLLGVSIGILLVGVGLSSVMSARFPYPVVHPGDSPFTNPQSSGTAASLVQSLSFLATLVLASPALIFGALGLYGDDGWAWASFAAGVGIGLIVLIAGVRVGGRIFDARATDLLAFSMRN
jgi:ABC-2 type transport system permease protein